MTVPTVLILASTETRIGFRPKQKKRRTSICGWGFYGVYGTGTDGNIAQCILVICYRTTPSRNGFVAGAHESE